MMKTTCVALSLACMLGCESGSSESYWGSEARASASSIPPPEAQSTGPRHYVCRRAASLVRVDGRLDERAWQVAPWTSRFIDIQGPHMPAPRYQTRMKMVWDDSMLYVGAVMMEPHVWGSLTEHDQIVFHDNDFEVFIDPDGDGATYYEIEVNALNTIFDLYLHRTYRDGGPADHDWNCLGLKTAVHVQGTLNDPADRDLGWSVEMAIPFGALAEHAGVPVPPRVGDTWRMNFSRVEWRHQVTDGVYERIPDTPEDNWVWSPQHEINMHVPEHWGFVRFAE
jgi:hypothetical protein